MFLCVSFLVVRPRKDLRNPLGYMFEDRGSYYTRDKALGSIGVLHQSRNSLKGFDGRVCRRDLRKSRTEESAAPPL